MCLKNQIQQTLAEIVEKQERLAKLQSLEQKTNPTMQALYDLLEMYREVSPSDIPDLIAEITTTCHNYQKSIAPQIDSVEELTDTQCQQQLEVWSKEAIIPELEKLNQEAQVKTDSMPALTLWQPWATLIAEEVKRIETRSWSTNYRGPIAIHAAKRSIYTGSPELLDLLQEDSEPPLGAVVAIANLLDCVEMTPEFIAQQSDQELKCGDWQPGRFAWILEIIRPVVPPIPATGGQKLWNWSGTSIAAELEYLENKTELLGLVQFSHQVLAERQAKPEYATPTAEPEYEPDQAYDTVESILKSNGFFQPDDLEDYDSDEKYETYRGWDVYYSFPNGGVVSIGLYNAEYNQPWDVSTEYIQEIDNTFPESLADYDAIVKWTRTLIDKVENLEAPGQLALEFPKTDEEIPELGGNWEIESKVTPDEPTKLQKLLEGTNNYTFNKLGARVKIDSEFTENNHGEELEIEENALFTVTGLDGGKVQHYYHSAEDLTEQKPVAGWNPLGNLMNTAEKYAKKWAKEQSLDTKLAKTETEANFEAMGYTVQVYPQYASEELTGATFRFLDAEDKLVFDSSRTATEIGDRSWKTCACDLIQMYRDKETAKRERIENPHKKPEDDFVELVRLTPDVGYLKQKVGADAGKILAVYIAFANSNAAGKKTATFAKPRAKKWVAYFGGVAYENRNWKVEEPRKVQRMTAKPGDRQQFAYEIKITGNFQIEQLHKLAEYDFNLLPEEIGISCHSATTLQPDQTTPDTRSPETNATEKVTEKESLSDREAKIVELIRAALLKFNAEAVQEINSAEVPELVRNKIWESLSEVEQKVYELLLKLEFAQAPDFSVHTPEFVTSVDGKQGKSVFLNLRAIDGVSSRVWRYQGQTGDGGYPCKEAAAVAVWLQ